MVEIRIDGKLYLLPAHDHMTTCIIRLIKSASVDTGEYLARLFEVRSIEYQSECMGSRWMVENGLDIG